MSAATSLPDSEPPQSTINNPNSSLFLIHFTELLDFSSLISHSLLHPLSALNTNLPHLNPLNMFGGKSFNPATDIPNLNGKVILVTGGMLL